VLEVNPTGLDIVSGVDCLLFGGARARQSRLVEDGPLDNAIIYGLPCSTHRIKGGYRPAVSCPVGDHNSVADVAQLPDTAGKSNHSAAGSTPRTPNAAVRSRTSCITSARLNKALVGMPSH
jgi:hypothetical protein